MKRFELQAWTRHQLALTKFELALPLALREDAQRKNWLGTLRVFRWVYV